MVLIASTGLVGFGIGILSTRFMIVGFIFGYATQILLHLLLNLLLFFGLYPRLNMRVLASSKGCGALIAAASALSTIGIPGATFLFVHDSSFSISIADRHIGVFSANVISVIIIIVVGCLLV